MGPPKAHHNRRPLSASRFYEGSMHDRTSARPPSYFLGPDEAARLEREKDKPLRPASDDWADKQVKRGRLLGQVWDGVRGRLRFRREAVAAVDEEKKKEQQRAKSRAALTRNEEERQEGSFEQLVETGFFATQGEKGDKEKTTTATAATTANTTPLASVMEKGAMPVLTPKPSSTGLRPTREEVLENYHHLVASGFFSSHAIQSTRQPRRTGTPTPTAAASMPASTSAPGPAPSSASVPSPIPESRERPSRRPTPSSSVSKPPSSSTLQVPTASSAPSTRAPSPSRRSHDSAHPPWPLSRFATPTPTSSRGPSPSPSRGTKRSATPLDCPSDIDDDTKENDPPTPKKKLRKSASRDMAAAAPKLRTVSSRRNLLPRRSVSGPTSSAREPSKLTKRVLSRLPGASGRASPQVCLPPPPTPPPKDNDDEAAPAPTVRRCASGLDRRDPVIAPPPPPTHNRVLRPRRSANEGLYVVPDRQRGIPSVPAIPAKFTYGEDRENNGPWRGLRVAAGVEQK